MEKKAIIYCKRGLGDSLMHLVVAENLRKNGYSVKFFSDCLGTLEVFFPKIMIFPFSLVGDQSENLEGADLIIIKSEGDKRIKDILEKAKKIHPSLTWEIHPTTCKSKNPLPGDVHIDPCNTMVFNLERFCREDLLLEEVKKDNGLIVPTSWVFRKEKKRVIIHPTSSAKEKNWPIKKFFSLTSRLKKKGWTPVWVMTKREREGFSSNFFEGIEVIDNYHLFQVAKLIYESGYFIGNDSGLGHLASNLGIETLTICPVKRKRHLWLPGFARAEGASPLSLFPNWKFLRLQNRFWHLGLSVSRVIRAFERLVES